jgi:hypothetical protein
MASFPLRKENDYTPGTVSHFIIDQCEKARQVQPFQSTLVMVPSNGLCSNRHNHPSEWEFGEERYGEAFAADYPEHVVVLWANRRHVFHRQSGRCVESPDGIMRSWQLHPFEVTKNKRVGDSYGENGEAPVTRVPVNSTPMTAKSGDVRSPADATTEFARTSANGRTSVLS